MTDDHNSCEWVNVFTWVWLKFWCFVVCCFSLAFSVYGLVLVLVYYGCTVLLRLKIQPRKLWKFTKVAENHFYSHSTYGDTTPTN